MSYPTTVHTHPPVAKQSNQVTALRREEIYPDIYKEKNAKNIYEENENKYKEIKEMCI